MTPDGIYQEPTYWDKVAHNFGLQHLTALEGLALVVGLSLFLLIALVFVFGPVPRTKAMRGPYFLFGALLVWLVSGGWWRVFVLAFGLVGAVNSVLALKELWNRKPWRRREQQQL
jgi:hypothetical protein